MKSIVLVDGEHYPPVIARAIEQLLREGEQPVLALMVGGKEKLGQTNIDLGIKVEPAGADREAALASAIDQTGARLIIDISDQPVLGYADRCRMISVALWKGARYKGADFEFTPADAPPRPQFPSMAVFGTGKRAGKTSITGAAARVLKKEGFNPVVVAMGRGGPPEPESIQSCADLSPRYLMDLVEQGRHAASDYIEDALTARVPAVGAWRAGGGFSGVTAFGNYPDALRVAEELDPGMLILEGSGAAIPPAKADAGIFTVDARIDPADLCGYFGLYRVLLADLVVLTMCEETVDSGQISAVKRCIWSCSLNHPTVVETVFRPHPLEDISGKSIWFASTASEKAAEVQTQYLTKHYNAEVVGVSRALADRPQLLEDLKGARRADVLLVELKAAAVDVATRYALDTGMEVVYLDNRPHPVRGDPELWEAHFVKVATSARERFG